MTIDALVDNLHKEEFINMNAKIITKNNPKKDAQIIRSSTNLKITSRII